MFSVITNIYNKKTKGPTLMEFFTATGRVKRFFIWRVCDNNLNDVSMCAMSPAVHTSNISSCQKKNFFCFFVAVKNSIKVGPLVFLF
jgi:hypothetical protein